MFQALNEGATYAEAAALVGRARSTISGWVRRWRDIYGDDVLVSPRTPGKIDREASLRGSVNGGAVTAAQWAARREHEASEAGAVAAKYRHIVNRVAEFRAADDEWLASLGPNDVLTFARVFDLLSERADRLSDRDRRSAIAVQQTTTVDVDLSALEYRPGEDDEVDEVLRAVETIYQQFGSSGEVNDDDVELQ